MGSSYWSNDFYAEREQERKKTNTPVFKHDADIRAGKVAQVVHERLDPSKMKNGAREARDSKEHPNSLPIIVGLDITGSMRHVPGIVQKRLGKLMTTILEKGIAPDPQICFLGIGDSHTDMAKLQVGQFESGLEMEDDLQHLWLEGMGGGTGEEGYELALLFAARMTATDQWDKRKKKGHLFLIGDERAYNQVSPRSLQQVFGGEATTEGIPLTTLLKEVTERYHVHFIIPAGVDDHHRAFEFWENLLGVGHVLRLSDPEQICDLLALTIGLVEGTATSASLETLTPAIKQAIDPVLASTKKSVADAKKSGDKTARL
jgi:hypothetical protein